MRVAERAPGAPARRPYLGTLGGALLAVGLALLLVTLLDVDLGRVAWPLLLLAAGTGLGVLALAVSAGRAGEALAVASGVMLATGLVLLYRTGSGRAGVWVSGWALAGPVAAGTALWLHGAFRGRPEVVANGRRLAAWGLAVFVLLAVAFEVLAGGDGQRDPAGRYLLPLLLIGAGLWLRRGAPIHLR